MIRAAAYRLYWGLRSELSAFGPKHCRDLLEESQRWAPERLERLRDEKLKTAVGHAYAHSPLYRQLMDQLGVRPADIRGVRDLGRLPILTKELLRVRGQDLRARNIPDEETELNRTGGTTGTPLAVRRDRAGTTWQRGCYFRGLEWGGLRFGAPWVQLFGGSLGLTASAPRARLKAWFSGKTFLPAFELRPDTLPRYLQAIRRSGARHLVGYASACHSLATLANEAGAGLRLDAVFPTAEPLYEHQRADIAGHLGARSLPYYGCGEILSLGYSCPEAPGYHACDEHAVIEVERADGSTALEGEGAFLVTDLDNLAMPLIRYRNGDAGVMAGPGCACGRTLRRILRVDGRVSDLLVTTSGARISGAIGPHAFRLVEHVESFQIVQRSPGQAIIRIVAGSGYDAGVEEAKIRRIFGPHLGDGSVVDFEYVEAIAKSPAGKARFVLNEYLSAAARPS